MPAKRRRPKRRRGDDVAEARAWARFFGIGYDYLNELAPYGVDARCFGGERSPELMKEAQKAWRRFGTAYQLDIMLASLRFASDSELRAVVGFEVAHQCNLEARLDGSLLYRVGPDPARDVVAFCGRHNAGGEVGDAAGNHIFHAWLVMGDCIVDLSAIDWPAIDFCGDDIPGPAGELGPVQWTISVPPVLYGPLDECASSHDGL